MPVPTKANREVIALAAMKIYEANDLVGSSQVVNVVLAVAGALPSATGTVVADQRTMARKAKFETPKTFRRWAKQAVEMGWITVDGGNGFLPKKGTNETHVYGLGERVLGHGVGVLDTVDTTVGQSDLPHGGSILPTYIDPPTYGEQVKEQQMDKTVSVGQIDLPMEGDAEVIVIDEARKRAEAPKSDDEIIRAEVERRSAREKDSQKRFGIMAETVDDANYFKHVHGSLHGWPEAA